MPVPSKSNLFCRKPENIKMPDATETPPVKFTITHHRQPQHTHEAFINWIVKGHLPLAIPVFKKYGVIDYSLVRISSRALARSPNDN